jgi:hypothetical protein
LVQALATEPLEDERYDASIHIRGRMDDCPAKQPGRSKRVMALNNLERMKHHPVPDTICVFMMQPIAGILITSQYIQQQAMIDHVFPTSRPN